MCHTSKFYTLKIKAQIVFYAECPLVNPDPWPLPPSSTTNNSREQHGTVVGCSYLRTVVSEALQQGLRVGGNWDLVPIRPCDRLYQCHTDVKHSKQLCVEVKVHSSKYRMIHRHLQSRVMSLFPFPFLHHVHFMKGPGPCQELWLPQFWSKTTYAPCVCEAYSDLCMHTLLTFEIHSLDPGRVLYCSINGTWSTWL